MTRFLIPITSGILFGAGLAISGMMDPARVRGFLDIFGNWDPTLAFVMAGALFVMAIGWAAQRRMATPVAADSFHLPTTSTLDRKLVFGAILFGAGWGLSGLCPGPGIASLGVNFTAVTSFVIAMLAGMGLHRLTQRAKA